MQEYFFTSTIFSNYMQISHPVLWGHPRADCRCARSWSKRRVARPPDPRRREAFLASLVRGQIFRFRISDLHDVFLPCLFRGLLPLADVLHPLLNSSNSDPHGQRSNDKSYIMSSNRKTYLNNRIEENRII